MQGILAGRYRLDRQLGKGGMGSVWLAEHLALNSWVAVKLMDPSLAATTEGAERFRREAQAAASLRSAHVVQVLDYGVHEATPFLVMELLQGESLAGCLEREGRLAPERTLSIMTQVARAVARAHAGGIVHRDLKPDNIFLVREDDQELAKVLDFGIAKTTGPRFAGLETRTGVTMGTPYYMSPEQVEGKKALDHRSDLWSLAVITCECLTGIRPFDGETFGELLLNICARPVSPPSAQGFYLPGFDEWFARATDRDPERRFSSAQQMATALSDVLAARGREVAAGVLKPTLAMSPQTLAFAGTLARTTTEDASSSARDVRAKAARRRLLPLLLAGVAVLAVPAVLWLWIAQKPVRGVGDSTPIAAAESKGPLPAQTPTPPSATPGVGASGVSAGGVSAGGVSEKPGEQRAPRAVLGERAANAPSAPRPVSGALPVVLANPVSPSAAAEARPQPRLERCFTDPFTGQIRVADAGHASGSFICHQNPFTGAYQRQ